MKSMISRGRLRRPLAHSLIETNPFDATAVAVAAAEARCTGQPLRVLVIDDLANERASLCASLSELGCEVIGTSSRIGGREIAWLEHVDVVVAQHQPARVDGARLVELVRDHAPDLPAIVLRAPIERDVLARVIGAVTVSRDR
jgi:CheY-like chemotaxis protein